MIYQKLLYLSLCNNFSKDRRLTQPEWSWYLTLLATVIGSRSWACDSSWPISILSCFFSLSFFFFKQLELGDKSLLFIVKLGGCQLRNKTPVLWKKPAWRNYGNTWRSEIESPEGSQIPSLSCLSEQLPSCSSQGLVLWGNKLSLFA